MTGTPAATGEVLAELDRLLPATVDPSTAIRSRASDRVGAPPPRTWLVGVLRTAVLVALVCGWELLARLGILNAFFWSMPSRIGAKLATEMRAGRLVEDTLFTVTSTVSGFVLGTAIGVSLGLSFWWSRTYARAAEPFVVAFEALPKLALAPIVVLVLGIGLSSKVAMATALVVAVQALNASAGVRAVDPDLTRMLASLGASRWKIFRSVVVPSTLPSILSGLRVTIGLALTGAIIGEYIGSQHGLGRLIVYAGTVYDIALIWVGVAILAFLAIVLYVLVTGLEWVLRRRLLHSY